MSDRHAVLRTLHDVGLAAWFGGSLMGAVSLNAAAGVASEPAERSAIANAGWDRWTPVNAAAIGAHLVGAAGLLVADRGRIARQQGVGRASLVKTALTAGALGVTAYSRVLGRAVKAAGPVPVASGTESTAGTPPKVSSAQSQLQALQWAIPGLTGGLLTVSAVLGEQQRAPEVLRGTAKRAATLIGSGLGLGAH